MLRCRGVRDGNGAAIGVLVLLGCQRRSLEEGHSRGAFAKDCAEAALPLH